MRLELPTRINTGVHAARLIPDAVHAMWNARRYANTEMARAGLIQTTREGIWLIIAEQILYESGGIKLTNEHKRALVDVFTVLRRIYKSADSAWDQSQDIRDRICRNPLARATDRLVWNHDGFDQITDLSLAVNYLETTLPKYFDTRPEKTDVIIEHIDDFIKDAVFGLAYSEKLRRERSLDFDDRLGIYQKTTGRIGRTIARIIGTITDTDEYTVGRMETAWEKASIASQIVDDMRDAPEDVIDDASLSVVKYWLGHFGELGMVDYFARRKSQQIPYGELRKLAPQTVKKLDTFITDYINDLPHPTKNFLMHFYYGLGQKAVNHSDYFNRMVHTDPQRHRLLHEYVETHGVISPHKLVEFCEFIKPQERAQMALLIDPEKQLAEVAAVRANIFFQQGGNIVFVGGSKIDDNRVFQHTASILSAEAQKFLPPKTIIIFPGDIDQIPGKPEGITGVLNYSDIVGAQDSPIRSDYAYPREAKTYVKKTLKEKGLRSIPTAYFLCGECSATRKTGMTPIDLTQQHNIDYLYQQVERMLKKGVACIYLEGGSGVEKPIPVEVAIHVRYLIDQLSPQTLLIVGGGIKTDQQLHEFSAQAHLIVVGNYLETIPTEHLAGKIKEMISAVK